MFDLSIKDIPIGETQFEEDAIEHQIGINDLVSLLNESKRMELKKKAVIFLYLFPENNGRFEDDLSERETFRKSLIEVQETLKQPIHYYSTISLQFNDYYPQTSMYPIPPLLSNCFDIEHTHISSIQLINFLLKHEYAQAVVVQPRIRYKGDGIDCIYPAINSLLIEEIRRELGDNEIESYTELQYEIYNEHPEWGFLYTN